MPEGPDSDADRFDLIFKVDQFNARDWSHALAEQGHEVAWVNWRDFDPTADGGRGGFRRLYLAHGPGYVRPPPLASFDLLWIYKMEGFLVDQPWFFAMVDAFEATGAVVINDPPLIRHNIDKHYLLQLQSAGIRTVPSSGDGQQARAWLEAGREVIAKPWRSERSIGQQRLTSTGDLDRLGAREDGWLFQPLVPEVVHGERSLVFLGKAFQFAAIKVPKPGEIRTNQTFRIPREQYHPEPDELALAEATLAAYAGLGFQPRFSRIDLLRDAQGPMVIEAELLNPTTGAEVLRDDQFTQAIVRYLVSLI